MYRMTLDGSDASTTLFRSTQLDGINHHDYQTVQEFYHSKDGTRVPMFIFAHKDVKRDGTAPTLLYGSVVLASVRAFFFNKNTCRYGGFNISIDPGLSSIVATHSIFAALTCTFQRLFS